MMLLELVVFAAAITDLDVSDARRPNLLQLILLLLVLLLRQNSRHHGVFVVECRLDELLLLVTDHLLAELRLERLNFRHELNVFILGLFELLGAFPLLRLRVQ